MMWTAVRGITARFFSMAPVVGMLCFFSAHIFAADRQFDELPDSSGIRATLVESWFEAPLSAVRQNNTEIRQNEFGKSFQIRLEESDTSFSIFVSPEQVLNVDVYNDKGMATVPTKVYPADIPGSWVLVRDKKNGDSLRIRYYFMADSDVYIQFTPAGDRCFADMVIFGLYAAKSVPVGIPFERLYTASFYDILSWTEHTFPWQYVTVYTDMYHASLQMIQVIRKNLSRIVYADDGMYDEHGDPVYISTGKPRVIDKKDADKLSLSSAGFVKWIVDGLVEPISGSYIKRDPLLTPTVSYMATGFPGTLNNEYNLSFALDWTRNLAAAALSVRLGKTFMYSDSAVDVGIEPFSAELTANGIKNTAGYIKDSGYRAGTLKALLYVLASTESSYFYLAAVRQTDMKSPEVKVFNQCAVFFPYFDTSGHFACVVFQNGVESNLDDFISKYSDCFIHLTRVQTSDIFFPQ